MHHIKNANLMSIQKLLLVDDPDDLLMFLKARKLDEVLKNKFSNNISNVDFKMFKENLF